MSSLDVASQVPLSVRLEDKLHLIREYFHPRIVAELNGQYVKLAKFLGEFVWHAHENEDELFLVLHGSLKIQFEGARTLELHAGQLAVVPRGLRHRPVADEEVHVLLFEPASTLHTGDVVAAVATTGEWI